MFTTDDNDETPRKYTDGEYRLRPEYQEEQYSARWEDRYGPVDEYDDCDEGPDWEGDD
jgi:hypothetical protein